MRCTCQMFHKYYLEVSYNILKYEILCATFKIHQSVLRIKKKTYCVCVCMHTRAHTHTYRHIYIYIECYTVFCKILHCTYFAMSEFKTRHAVHFYCILGSILARLVQNCALSITPCPAVVHNSAAEVHFMLFDYGSRIKHML
jgi:hypothetical protein